MTDPRSRRPRRRTGAGTRRRTHGSGPRWLSQNGSCRTSLPGPHPYAHERDNSCVGVLMRTLPVSWPVGIAVAARGRADLVTNCFDHDANRDTRDQNVSSRLAATAHIQAVCLLLPFDVIVARWGLGADLCIYLAVIDHGGCRALCCLPPCVLRCWRPVAEAPVRRNRHLFSRVHRHGMSGWLPPPRCPRLRWEPRSQRRRMSTRLMG